MAVLACKDNDPVSPEGVWIKNSTGVDNEILGILELKKSSLFVFIADQQGHTDTNGRYSLSKNHITFEDDTCYSAGTYSYTVSENNLSFSTISDMCKERVKVLEGQWARKN